MASAPARVGAAGSAFAAERLPTETAASAEPPGKTGLSARTWPQVLEELPLSDSFRTVAAMLVVGDFNRPKVEFTAARDDMVLISERFRQALEEAMTQWAGERLKITIQPVDDEELATPAMLHEKRVARTQAEAEKAIDADPFVQSLVQNFDAEVVRESIRPINTRSH